MILLETTQEGGRRRGESGKEKPVANARRGRRKARRLAGDHSELASTGEVERREGVSPVEGAGERPG